MSEDSAMRRVFTISLCLFITGFAHAAPTTSKDDLPAGAIARLGTARAAQTNESAQPKDINSLTFINDQTLFVATNSGWLSWDLVKRQQRQAKPVGGPAFMVARDRDRLLIGGARKLHLVEPPESATLEPRQGWDSSSDMVKAVAYASGSGRIVYSEGERGLNFLSLTTGKVISKITLESPPTSTSFAGNGRILAVATRDGSVRVYALSPKGEIEPLWAKRFIRNERNCVTYSHDGRILAVGTAGRVVLLEGATGQLIRAFDRRFGEGDVRSVAFSPSGLLVAAGTTGPEPLVRLWDVLGGQERAIYKGHQGSVDAVAFAPDGKTMASGGTDGSIFLWTVPSMLHVEKDVEAKEAWSTLDSLDPKKALHLMNSLAAAGPEAVDILRQGVLNASEEQERMHKWIKQLDHDEFRVREAARKGLMQAGLRSMPLLTDPKRPKMGAEGEQRVQLVLGEFEKLGLRASENGLYGEPLRHLRAVRILEQLNTKAARTALEEIAKGKPELRGTIEAKAALVTLPESK
jgi:hypothetical protein